MSEIKPNGAFKRFLTTVNVMQTLKISVFPHRVAGLSVSMVNSRQSGRYLGANTGLLAAQGHRYQRGQRPLEYTLAKFYFTAVTF